MATDHYLEAEEWLEAADANIDTEQPIQLYAASIAHSLIELVDALNRIRIELEGIRLNA